MRNQNTSPTNTLDNSSFAERMASLESIVKKMESGELSLEDALNAYAQGTQLLQACQQALQEAEQSVMLLNQQQQLTPFDPQE